MSEAWWEGPGRVATSAQTSGSKILLPGVFCQTGSVGGLEVRRLGSHDEGKAPMARIGDGFLGRLPPTGLRGGA